MTSAPPLRAELPLTPLPRIDGGFRTVLADPPWRFTNRTGKVAPEHRRLDRYSTLTVDAIRNLPVAESVAPKAHLYLWVPNALLPDALAVMEAWGFRYISNIVWAKRRKDGGPDGRGVGFYFRNVTELLLFGVRGSMRTLSPARRQVNMIETRKREHSRKPDEQYQVIESCSPGPRLELFSRHPRPGWTVWGDESPDHVTPRGRVHQGYAGGPVLGPLLAPPLAPHQRLTPEEQKAVGERFKAEYDLGTTINDLAEQTGYSITRTRRLLTQGGARFRDRGRHPRLPEERTNTGRGL